LSGVVIRVWKTLKGPPILRRQFIILEKAAPVKGTFSVAMGEAK